MIRISAVSTISSAMRPLRAAEPEPAGFGGFDFGGDMGDIFGDIFGDLFGGGRGRRGNSGPQRGANLRAVIHISFEEAVFGCEKELELTAEGYLAKNAAAPAPNRAPLRRPVPSAMVPAR